MAVQVHVAELGLFRVDLTTGDVYQPSKGSRSIKQNLNFDTQFRVVIDASNSNTDGNPTIKEYLQLEAAGGYEPVQVFQTMIITKKVT